MVPIIAKEGVDGIAADFDAVTYVFVAFQMAPALRANGGNDNQTD